MEIKNENDSIQHVILTDIDGELAKIRPGYTEYQEVFKKTFDFVVSDGPLYIPFEVNDYCNMKCKMCWRAVSNNPGGKHQDIDMNLLDKFIRDCKDANVKSFFLGANSECLINPNITEIIRHIRENGCGIDDVLITNGYELNEDICKLLIHYQWEKVFVSLDAATMETYQKIRGRNLRRVEKNIQRLLDMRRESGSKLPFVRVSFVVMEENKHEINEFIDKWKDKVDRIDFQTLMPPEDTLTIEHLPDTDRRCSAPFRKLSMDSYGNIFPCASLYDHQHLLGNIKDMSIKEAWNCDKIKRIRDEMLTGKMNDICKNCLRTHDNLIEIKDHT